MKHATRRLHRIAPALAVLLLAGCGDGGLDDDDGDGSGKLAVAVVDAPVDSVDKVVVKFADVEIKTGDETFLIDRAPVQVDLLATYSAGPFALVTTPDLPAGEFDQLRLEVISSRETLDSYVQIGDTQYPLYIPSGAESGLKINGGGLEVPDGGVRSLVVDFDIRKSLVDPEGQPGYHLKPVLRLVDEDAVGFIAGAVAAARLTAAGCTGDPNTLDGYAVYAYAGAATTPGESGGTVGAEPLTSGLLYEGDNDTLVYRIGYLPPGSYTVAFTCQAASDDPESNDGIVFQTPVVSTTVTAGQTTAVDFP